MRFGKGGGMHPCVITKEQQERMRRLSHYGVQIKQPKNPFERLTNIGRVPNTNGFFADMLKNNPQMIRNCLNNTPKIGGTYRKRRSSRRRRTGGRRRTTRK